MRCYPMHREHVVILEETALKHVDKNTATWSSTESRNLSTSIAYRVALNVSKKISSQRP